MRSFGERAFNERRSAGALSLGLVLLAGAIAWLSGRLLAFETLGAKWGNGSPAFRINPNFPDVTLSGSIDQQIEIIRCASQIWRDQSRAKFQFQYLGTTTVRNLTANDGVNAVFWSNQDGGDALAVTLFAGNNGVALAFDTTFFRSTNNVTNRWSGPGEPAAGTFDIMGVATHELGHALGLDHTPIAQATMFASASGRALGLRTLHIDDRNGIESLYGLRTADPPNIQISSLTPAFGPTAGGNEVVLAGINFTYGSDTTLFLDDLTLPSTRWNVESCTRLRILQMPSHRAGTASIKMVNTVGTLTLDNAYHYGGPPPEIAAVDPTEGPTSGGIEITLSGQNFGEDAVVTVGGRPLAGQHLVNSTTITGTLPSSQDGGKVDVRIDQGGDTAVLVDGFTYNAYLLSVADTQGVPGQASLPVELRVRSPVDLSTVSFGVAYDKALLAVREFSMTGTPAEGAELVASNIDNAAGVSTFAMIMSISNPTPVFPLGDNVLLTHMVADISPGALAGDEVAIELKDEAGSPPIQLTFTQAGSLDRIRPLVKNGKVTVVSGTLFVRGDANHDGKTDISDAIYHLDFFFRGGRNIICRKAADTNDDGKLDISDAVRTLSFLFQGSLPPPPPFPVPGTDPTADTLSCDG
jgi:hypothetical protein